eukprot:3368376-Prorocentrum_lima.AAC.1
MVRRTFALNLSRFWCKLLCCNMVCTATHNVVVGMTHQFLHGHRGGGSMRHIAASIVLELGQRKE